jgi:hypothetical protein
MRTSTIYLTQTCRKWNVLILAVVAALGMTCSTFASAQSGAGSIQGTVTDTTGAVIPDATIHVVKRDTQVATDSKTNSAGFYQVPDLFTGSYVVTITAKGFSALQRTLSLQAAQTGVINASLTAGAVTQQVEVKGDTEQLTDTTSGTITSTLESARINQLPTNTREILTLGIETTPGMESGPGYGGEGVNGMFGEAMEYVDDGVPVNNRQFGGINQEQSQLPDPDAVQQVTTETSGLGAQFATPATTIITTKSGTNAIHGSAFETAVNNAFGVARNRNDLPDFSAPHFVRNEFGVSAGGPIILPHIYHGKNKSFWFLAYERFSLADTAPVLVAVPPTAWRNGDFSGYTNGAGVYQQLYDPDTTTNSANCNGTGKANPYCRVPFGNGILGDPGNNQIPIARLAPMTKILYDITPLPSNSNNPMVTGSNLSTPNPSLTVIPTITFRLDHAFDDNNRAYVRYTSNTVVSHSLRNTGRPASLAADGFPTWATGESSNPSASFAAGIGFTHIFSPTFFSETIVSQQWLGQHNDAAGAPNTDFEQELGGPNNFGRLGFPAVGLYQLMNGSGGWEGTQYEYGLSQIVQNLDENLTLTRGQHQMEFGGRFRHERFGEVPDQTNDYWFFSGQGTAIYDPGSGGGYSSAPGTGGLEADNFLGYAGNYQITTNPSYDHFRDFQFAGYFQDNYRVSKFVTLNLGLRWEDYPAALTTNGLYSSFDLKNDALVMQTPPAKLIQEGYTTQAILTNLENIGVKFETPQQAGFPSSLMRNYPFNFLPRAGFAWQIFGDKRGTVLRGAYGRYTYPENVRSYQVQPIKTNPLLDAQYSQNWGSANQTPDGLPNATLRYPQGSGPWSPTSPFLPIMGINSSNNVNTSANNGILPGSEGPEMNPASMPPDYITEANVTIEQALKGNSALRVSWVLTHGTNLDHINQYNNAPSPFVWMVDTGTIPNTANNSLATRPYDNTTWGPNSTDQKDGWSTDNSLQVNYQRLFHHGIAYQISYVWSKPMRFGGFWYVDSNAYPYANYLGVLGSQGSWNTNGIVGASPVTQPALPPPPPTGSPLWQSYHALNRFEGYQVDTGVPKQHIRFNGVVDLPFGRGKKFLGGVNRAVDEIVGGWQVAGDGQVISQDFNVDSSDWGPTNPIHYYKKKIMDCQSTCQPAKLWFNGYITPTPGVMGKISGLPGGYVVGQAGSPAFESPITFDGTETNNNVNVVLADGTTLTQQNFSPGPAGSNPHSKTVINGPMNYNANLSLFKVFPIKGQLALRFNVDAFNAFNIQGYNNPNSTTGENLYAPGAIGASSYWAPRQIQLTMRVEF